MTILPIARFEVLSRPVPKDSGWRLFLRTVWGRAYPRLIGWQREKSWFLFEVLLPMLSVAAYVFVYRALQAPEAYVGFVVLGGAMTAFWLNVLWGMSTQLYWEKEQGNLALYIIAPGPLMAILLGMALGGMASTAVQAVAIVLMGSWLFQVHYVVASWPLLGAVFGVTMLALYGLGMLFASLFLLFSREAWHWANLMQEPVYLLSGFYFPVRNLPFWVAVAGSILPLTLGLDAMRQLLFPAGERYGLFPVGWELAMLGVLSGVYLGAARVMLAYMERLARQEGRLTESRS